MVRLILGVLGVGLALILLKIVPVLAGIVLMVVGLFAAIAVGARRDQSRQRGPHDPANRFDSNRRILPTSTEPLLGDPARLYPGYDIERPPGVDPPPGAGD